MINNNSLADGCCVGAGGDAGGGDETALRRVAAGQTGVIHRQGEVGEVEEVQTHREGDRQAAQQVQRRPPEGAQGAQRVRPLHGRSQLGHPQILHRRPLRYHRRNNQNSIQINSIINDSFISIIIIHFYYDYYYYYYYYD